MKANMANVVITIPVYREELSEHEESSFRRSCAVFGNKYSVTAFAPEGMDMTKYTAIFPELKIERFPAHFFRSIGDYSRLLLSEEFYERFSTFEWMLICQLDVWVFRDELEYWCGSDVDFLGAPVPARHDPGEKIESELYVAGNGGFSLRRISAFLEILKAGDKKMYSNKILLSFFLNHLKSGHFFKALIPLVRMAGFKNRRQDCLKILKKQGVDEDMVFRTLSFSEIPPFLTFASTETAAKFAFDGGSVWRYYNKTHHIPFALHAWHLYEGPEFMEYLRNKYGNEFQGSKFVIE